MGNDPAREPCRIWNHRRAVCNVARTNKSAVADRSSPFLLCGGIDDVANARITRRADVCSARRDRAVLDDDRVAAHARHLARDDDRRIGDHHADFWYWLADR